MFETQILQQQILQAIDASEKIVASLRSGDLEEAEKQDNKRAECVRALSKWRNFDAMAIPYTKEIEKLAELDKTILLFGQQLHDEVLTEMRQEQTNRVRHVQYVQNQRL